MPTQQIVTAARIAGEGALVGRMISGLVTAGIEGGYLANFRVASRRTRFVCNFAALGLHYGFGLSVTPNAGRLRSARPGERTGEAAARPRPSPNLSSAIDLAEDEALDDRGQFEGRVALQAVPASST